MGSRASCCSCWRPACCISGRRWRRQRSQQRRRRQRGRRWFKSFVFASWRALGNGWPGLPWQAALAGKGIRHAGGISCGNTTSLGKPLTQQRKKQIDILGHRVDAARPARAGGGLSAQPTHHVQHLCDSLQQGHRHAVSGAPPPLTIWTVRQQAGSAVCTVPAHASLGRLPAHVPPGGLRCHVAPGAANWAAGGHHHKW